MHQNFARDQRMSTDVETGVRGWGRAVLVVPGRETRGRNLKIEPAQGPTISGPGSHALRNDGGDDYALKYGLSPHTVTRWA
jgi:hypothetical protein